MSRVLLPPGGRRPLPQAPRTLFGGFLPHGHRWDDVIGEVGGGLGHVAAVAGRAGAAALSFLVLAWIGSRSYEPAWGRNKNEAEQRAAANALAELGHSHEAIHSTRTGGREATLPPPDSDGAA